MIKKSFTLLFLVILSFIFTTCGFGLPLQSPSAVLLDMTTGQILYEHNSNESLYPASTTKIMTAILAIENKKLDDKDKKANKHWHFVVKGISTIFI